MGSFVYKFENHVMTTCPSCKVQHSIPRALFDAAQLRADAMTITCPNGHNWHYKSKKELSEEDAIRLERDRLRQRLAEKDDMLASNKKEAAALKGKITKLHNRAKAGLCSCCNRHFTNLERHMASKHKDGATVQ